MSKQLYDEALADVKKIKEIALNDAKHAVIEAVTPAIRKLIDDQIMLESCDDVDPGDAEVDCDVLEDEAVTEDNDALSGDHGSGKPHKEIDADVKKLTAEIRAFAAASPKLRATESYRSRIAALIERVEATYEQTLTLDEGAARAGKEQKLESLFKALNRIQENVMKSRKNRINEEDVTVRLTGLPDGIDLDGIGVDLIGAEGDELGGGELDAGADLDGDVAGDAGAVDDLDVGDDSGAGIDLDDDEDNFLEGLQTESFDDVFGFGGPGDEEADPSVDGHKGIGGADGDQPEVSSEEDGDTDFDNEDHGTKDTTVPNRDADHADDRDKAGNLKPEDYDALVDQMTDARRDLNTDDSPISHKPPARDAYDEFGQPTGETVGGAGNGNTGSLGEGIDDDTIVEIDEAMLAREIKKMREARLGDPANKELNRPKYAGPDKKSYKSFGGSTVDEGDPFTDIDYEQPENLEDGTGPSRKPAMKGDKYGGQQMKGQKDFGGSKWSEGDPLEVDIDTEQKALGEAKVVVIPKDWDVAPDADDIHDDQIKELEKEKIKESLKQELTLEMRLVARGRARCNAMRTEAIKAKRAGNAKRVKMLGEAYKKTATSVNESIKTIKQLKQRLTAKPAAAKGIRENRVLQASAGSAEQQKLRAQLAEANLYNVKLSYANKLLQNGNLSAKQKAAVIQKLDEASTAREAKLLYDSMTQALQPRTVQEGAERKVLGSSSRSTRPGSTVQATPAPSLNEGVSFDTDRWAVMAGIKK